MIKGRIALGILLLLALGIKIFSFFPDAVENFYSGGIYPHILSAQNTLFGILPFSAGDCIYGLFLLGVFYLVVLYVRMRASGKKARQNWKTVAIPVLNAILAVYVSFNALWGLNYNRPGMDKMLGIDSMQIEKQDLVDLMDALVGKVNALDSAAHGERNRLADPDSLFAGAVGAYQRLSSNDARFFIKAPSIKASLFGSIGNYLGYTGYYNPFTGEAQVNTAVPLFLQPFTSCHELGHSLGFARENEANFAGYLAASASGDTAFNYSVYLDMFLYGRAYFKRTDSLMIQRWDARLDPLVKKDIEEMKQFFLRHQNPLERLIDSVYDSYLQANQQPDGKKTYGKVIYWLAAYRKKYGTL